MISLLDDNVLILAMSVFDLWRVVPAISQGSNAQSSSGIRLDDLLDIARVLVVVSLVIALLSRMVGLVSDTDLEQRLDRLGADD